MSGMASASLIKFRSLQEDPRLLLALLDLAPPGSFTRLAAEDGTTPFHLALQVRPSRVR